MLVTHKGVAEDKLRVFICYSRSEIADADALVTALDMSGFEVMIDRRDIPYGEEWQRELSDFIRAADTIIWLVSPNSVKSKWCNWELGEVMRLNKRLVPVKIRSITYEQLPETLGKISVLPAAGVYDPAIHFPILVTTLNSDRAWIEDH